MRLPQAMIEYKVEDGLIEKLELLFKNGLCGHPSCPLPDGVRVISDLPAAVAFRDQSAKMPEEFVGDPDYRPNGDFGRTYYDNLQLKIFNALTIDSYGIYKKYYEKSMSEDEFEEQFEDPYDELKSDFVSDICDTIPSKLSRKLRIMIGSDFDIIFEYLNFNDEENPLVDGWIQTYVAGGYPCGWSGNYPDGSLIVFWPHKEPPTFAS